MGNLKDGGKKLKDGEKMNSNLPEWKKRRGQLIKASSALQLSSCRRKPPSQLDLCYQTFQHFRSPNYSGGDSRKDETAIV
jgi:hypothetical protein